jgi:multiple sugar transport system permease protein
MAIPGKRITIKTLHLLILIVLGLLWVFPLFYGILSSFKIEGDIIAAKPRIFTATYTLINYQTILIKSRLFRWFLNSLLTTTATVVGICAVSAMAGYAFSKIRFPGRNVLFYALIATMFMPGYVLLIPRFLLIVDFKMYNTFWGIILPQMALPFGVFLVKQFMGTVPTSIIESPQIDGAGHWLIFTRIMVPISRAAIGSLAIFAFIRSWNNFFWQLVVVNTVEMRTLPVGLSYLQDDFTLKYGELLAGATMSAVPLLLIFFAFQKSFTKGVTMGAIKG